jgi:hypothetical protein
MEGAPEDAVVIDDSPEHEAAAAGAIRARSMRIAPGRSASLAGILQGAFGAAA